MLLFKMTPIFKVTCIVKSCVKFLKIVCVFTKDTHLILLLRGSKCLKMLIYVCLCIYSYVQRNIGEERVRQNSTMNYNIENKCLTNLMSRKGPPMAKGVLWIAGRNKSQWKYDWSFIVLQWIFQLHKIWSKSRLNYFKTIIPCYRVKYNHLFKLKQIHPLLNSRCLHFKTQNLVVTQIPVLTIMYRKTSQVSQDDVVCSTAFHAPFDRCLQLSQFCTSFTC